MNTLTLNVGSYPVSLLTSEHEGEPYIALRPLCEALGMDWKSQHARTAKNPQFHCGDITTVDAQGRNYPMVCLPVRQVGMWLCTINARRVKPEIRDRLIAFQEGLQVVIHEHLTGRLTLERVQQLENAVNQLTTLVNYLVEENEKKDQIIEKLEQRLEATGHVDYIEASCAGRRLAARRKTKRVYN